MEITLLFITTLAIAFICYGLLLLKNPNFAQPSIAVVIFFITVAVCCSDRNLWAYLFAMNGASFILGLLFCLPYFTLLPHKQLERIGYYKVMFVSVYSLFALVFDVILLVVKYTTFRS